MFKKFGFIAQAILLATTLADTPYSSNLSVQSTKPVTAPDIVPSPSSPPAPVNASFPSAGAQSAAPASRPPAAGAPVHFVPNGLPGRAHLYYAGFWGVDSLRVKAVESGELVRFTWRVLDPEKAAALNDKKAEPLLLDSQAGVKLVVPTMEKVGQLRQSSTPMAGKSYWMAFSNPGRRVKPGDFVSVVIGQFHAVGLVVE